MVVKLGVVSIVALTVSIFVRAAVLSQRLTLESERFGLFLVELTVRSASAIKPIVLSLNQGKVLAKIEGSQLMTFTPVKGITLEIRGATPEKPRDIRNARSCSPTTFQMNTRGIPLSCLATLSLRCRVRIMCAEEKK
jgi:hypothetical protein